MGEEIIPQEEGTTPKDPEYPNDEKNELTDDELRKSIIEGIIFVKGGKPIFGEEPDSKSIQKLGVVVPTGDPEYPYIAILLNQHEQYQFVIGIPPNLQGHERLFVEENLERWFDPRFGEGFKVTNTDSGTTSEAELANLLRSRVKIISEEENPDFVKQKAQKAEALLQKKVEQRSERRSSVSRQVNEIFRKWSIYSFPVEWPRSLKK